ncbi:ADP-forming succinate--CoA ligase subunit beta [Phaeovibrio sulfidiphilus]|uniref:Succinate--CoA ligase [ADP-forming] subunit beta n=1 Tax=Phaeovibrio sulfidiphilus TaxID=1220600 RepID=A0A8J7CDI0_9PROT|nr:ADP-forming succinate--CoA ligase subunit beta [Phaeovibrio sulfidiphilus]MBE1237758.1 ADP-forming succinate--CoA ligase subunit beta [Phaeovibrio sulfidiphilus]
MNLHEYQAKQVLANYGVPILGGGVAYTADEARAVAERLGGPVWVVKAQIHAGGRGKGHFLEEAAGGKGGVRVVKSLDDVQEAAFQMLGNTLVTHQSGPEGREVKRVYVEEGCDIARELYLSLLVDRATSGVTIMASTEGGMDIEEVAEKTPEKIIYQPISPETGMSAFHARAVAFALGLTGKQVSAFTRMALSLYECFVASDCAMLEINPLVVTGDGQILPLDCKMGLDPNALYRHPRLMDYRDESEEDPMELEASRHDLNYVKLDGTIGCMVNGAGLAMATMDIIKLKGGSPANFLDVGGGATRERVTAAFKIILSDPAVEGILVNIFGGIMRCDVIAEGVVAAARDVSLNVPLVVRLEGTNVELGKTILAESGLPIISADNLADAAEKVVKAVREAQ